MAVGAPDYAATRSGQISRNIIASAEVVITTAGTTTGSVFNIYDGDASTVFTFNGLENNENILFDFQRIKDFVSVTVVSRQRNDSMAERTLTYVIRYSNDNSTWTNIATVTDTLAAGANSTTRTHSIGNVRFRYLQIISTDADSTAQEIDIYDINCAVF